MASILGNLNTMIEIHTGKNIMDQYMQNMAIPANSGKTTNTNTNTNTNTLNESNNNESDPFHFGILHIDVEKMDIIQKTYAIYIGLDHSGSMIDICSDNRTKMQHAIHTLSNMFRVFSKTVEVKILICVDSFDARIEQIIEHFTQITPENVEELILKLHNIHPDGSTNIELALTTARSRIDEYTLYHPDHNIIHIQLTDGEATEGETNKFNLAELVSEKYSNIFIGFGKNHHAATLQQLSNTTRGDYRFVDKIENAGYVCGEIVHQILYTVIETATIFIENGEIYDWRNNKWNNCLHIPAITSGLEKVYNVRTRTPSIICGSLFGKTTETEDIHLLDDITTLPDLKSPDGSILPNDLTKYMFRQKTQEVLYEAKMLADNHNNYNNNNNNNDSNMQAKKRSNRMKIKVRMLFDAMTLYTNDTLNNWVITNVSNKDAKNNFKKFMKLLLDDVYIIYKVMDTPFAQMYTGARQTSQGRQQTYTATNVDDVLTQSISSSPAFNATPQTPIMTRSPSIISQPRTIAKSSRPSPFPKLHLENPNDCIVNSSEYINTIFTGSNMPPMQPPKLMRTPTIRHSNNNISLLATDESGNIGDDEEEDDNSDEDYVHADDVYNLISNHILSPSTDTTYGNDDIIDVMNSVSQNENNDENNEIGQDL